MTYQFEHAEYDVSISVTVKDGQYSEIAFTSTLYIEDLEELAEECNVDELSSAFIARLSTEMQHVSEEIHANMRISGNTDDEELTTTIPFGDLSAENAAGISLDELADSYVDHYMRLINQIIAAAKHNIRTSEATKREKT